MNDTQLLVGVLCIGLLASISGVTLATTPALTAQETQESEPADWADTCENAGVLEAGTYEGSLSPDDRDTFIVPNMNEGEYLALNFTFTEGADEIQFQTETSEEFAPITITAGTGAFIEDAYENTFNSESYVEVREQPDEDLSVYSLRVYAEDDGPVCVQFNTDGSSATNWRMSMEPQAPQAPPVICPPNHTADTEDDS